MGLCRRARWRWLAAGSVPVTSWEPRARGSSGGSGGLPGAGHAPGLSAPGWAARLGWGWAASAASGPAGSSCPRMARAQRAPRPRRAPAAVRAVARGRLPWPGLLGSASGCASGSVFQRVWGRDVQGTVSAPYNWNSLCRLCREVLPALLREGVVFCKAMILIFPVV